MMLSETCFLNLEKHTLSSKAQKNCLKLTASPSAVTKKPDGMYTFVARYIYTSIHYWERPTVCMYYCAIKNECC